MQVQGVGTGDEMGEGDQKVQTSRYKIGKSENAVNSMLATVNNTVLHIWKLLSESLSVASNSLGPHGLYSLWNSPGQNTKEGSLSLLQGIFPTQRLNPGLPHCRRILYQLSHKGSPRILEWVAIPFSSGSSQPRNWIRVSCIAGRFFTNWAIKEVAKIDLKSSHHTHKNSVTV